MKLLLPIVLLLTACSPGYVLRAAYEQTKILAARENIEAVVAQPDTTPAEREKLQLVIEAREFAKTIGLDPGGSFTKYTRINRDVLSWVVVGSKKDSFTLAAWWFPFVGTVPYKGFWEKEDAVAQAKELEGEDYETWVRGTDAYSTLGWFNDPVLSTMLRREPHDIVNTVIHESTHSTVWVKNHVDFNESLANFVGNEGAILFYEKKKELCPDEPCRVAATTMIEKTRQERARDLELSVLLMALRDELDALYTSNASYEEKLSRREEIFEHHIAPLRIRFPGMKTLQKINNAEIVQLILYMTRLETFNALFQSSGRSIEHFMEKIRSIADKVSHDSETKPFDEARELTL